MKVIELTRGKVALVDDEDYPRLSQYKWRYDASRASRGGWCAAHGRVTMKQEILHPPVGSVIDHISGNRLDNQRQNLRICTEAENSRNRRKPRGKYTSRFLGVSKRNCPSVNKWMAYCGTKDNGGMDYLGVFSSEEAAARSRDHAARKKFGKFAKFNFPMSDEEGALT